MKKEHITLLVITFLIILTIGSSSVGVYFFRQYKDAEKKLSNPTEAVKMETAEILAKVKKLMVLPFEDPQLITITNVEDTRGQQFFINAQNGDRVLLFTEAKKAVLYRPSTNMIVEVAPIISDPNQGAEATKSAVPSPSSVKATITPSPVTTEVPTKTPTPTP